MYADIIVDITHEKLDKVFQYRIPPELEGRVQIGAEVLVPFGRGNKVTKGYVIGFSEKCQYDLDKIKEIQNLSEDAVEIEGRMIALAAWMKEHYGGTMIQALRTVLPVKQKVKTRIKRTVYLCLSEEEGQEKLDFYLRKNQKARARLLAELLTHREISYELITKKLNVTASVIRALEEQGVLKIAEEQIYRNPVRKQERQKETYLYGRTAGGDYTLSDRLPARDTEDVSGAWDYGKRKNGSLYGNDGGGYTGRETSHCPDS